MIDYQRLPFISASMYYLDAAEEKPNIYMHDDVGDYEREPAKMNKIDVNFYDVRQFNKRLSLDIHGFKMLENQREPNFDHLDTNQIRESFYPTCAEIVKRSTGCKHAFAFDHNVRDYNLAKTHANAYKPVKFAHSDYTDQSAPVRLSEVDLENHYKDFSDYAFFNIWQPLLEPVIDIPLGLISHESIDERDLIDISLLYKERTGKILGIKYNPSHKWSFFSQMKREEIIVIKCFDSRQKVPAKFSIHAAFQNPLYKGDTPPRRSIEVRTIAFF